MESPVPAAHRQAAASGWQPWEEKWLGAGDRNTSQQRRSLPRLLAKGKLLPQVFLYNGGIREENEQLGPQAAALPLVLLEGLGAAGVLLKAVLCSADDPNPPSHQGPAIVWALRGPESALESFRVYY